MRVLIAVDGSECSRAPVLEAATRMWPEGTEFRVISAVEWEPIAPFVPGSMPLPPSPEAMEAADAMARQAAESAAGVLRERLRCPVLIKVVRGNARVAVVEEAKAWPADLILVGSHGRTGLRRLLMGSVAQGIVAHAPCSVQVVRSAGDVESHASA